MIEVYGSPGAPLVEMVKGDNGRIGLLRTNRETYGPDKATFREMLDAPGSPEVQQPSQPPQP